MNKKITACLAACLLLFTGCASMKHNKSNKREIIVRYAKNMLNKKYRYGKQDKHLGFDCSGLTQYSYREAGISIPRTSRSQYIRSKKLDKKDLKQGDLVFFSTTGPGVTHVGIYLGGSKFIHAPSEGKRVRIEKLNTGYWKKKYYGAGTYIK